MVHPFLDASLHVDFLYPVDIVGCGAGIRRACHELLDLFLSIVVADRDSCNIHPVDKARVVDDVFFECVAVFVYEINSGVGIVGVHLAAAFVDRHEDRLDARGGLSHQAGRSRGSNGQAGDVAATVLLHHLVQLGVCLA